MNGWSSPVRLAYASAQKWARTDAIVRVKNISYEKQVLLRIDNGGRWVSVPLRYAQGGQGYGEFAVEAAIFSEQFAVSAVIGGAEYWDNNGGGNYVFPLESAGGNVVGGEVCWWEGSFTRDPRTYQLFFRGEVRLNNRSYRKNVGVRLVQGSGSFIDIPCSPQGLVPEWSGMVEKWTCFQSSWPSSFGGPLGLAAYYEDLEHRVWYWDSNFGQNYTISVP
jgi:hypothetical protein